MGILYFVKKDFSDNEIEISASTGLMSIKEVDDGYLSSYKVEMQLNNLIREGDTLIVKNSDGRNF